MLKEIPLPRTYSCCFPSCFITALCLADTIVVWYLRRGCSSKDLRIRNTKARASLPCSCYAMLTCSPLTSHEHTIVRGIAQDLFHHPTERHFYESDLIGFLDDWSRDIHTHARFLQAKKSQPRLTIPTLFAEDVLGWKGMRCSNADGGCVNMPSPGYIREQFPNERLKARNVAMALEIARATYARTDVTRKIVRTAKDRLDG